MIRVAPIERPVRLTFELSGHDVHVSGDEAGLRALFDNLLENAARHGASHTRVELSAADGRARLTVDDDGRGIPEAERGRVFERFARGTSAGGPGSGLGLAIAARQAQLHGGTIELGEAPLGGARFTVELPVGPASSAGELR